MVVLPPQPSVVVQPNVADVVDVIQQSDVEVADEEVGGDGASLLR